MAQHGYLDYHTHTAVTVDGRMTVAQACDRAVAIGLSEIAFTNHSMLTEPAYNISLPDMGAHWRHIQECQEKYPGLTTRIGLELDYYPGREEEIVTVIRQYEDSIGRPLDLVLGAVHHLNGVFFSNKSNAPRLFDGQDLVKVYRDYFALATQAVCSGLFDVMAHPDLIKKYTDEFAPRLPFESYADAVEPFVDALLAHAVGIELNTKGLVLPVAEIYPSDGLLDLYIKRAKAKEIGPIITFGSDAHKVADVGARLDNAARTLRRAGWDRVTGFDRRVGFTQALKD